MQYLLLIIYVFIIIEWRLSYDPSKHGKTGYRRGQKFYRVMALVSIIIGGIGVTLRQAINITPSWLYFAFSIACGIAVFTGVYYVYKMVTTETP